MSKAHLIKVLPGNLATTLASASNVVVVGQYPIDKWERFALTYRNVAGAINFLDLQVQVAGEVSSQGSPVTWVQIPTATLPQPSALGAGSAVITAPIDNAYKWMRVYGRVTDVASAVSVLNLTIQGPKRF